MRFLLSAITSLSIVGGSATLATNAINQNIIKENNFPTPLYERRVDFGEEIKLSTLQNTVRWNFEFNYDLVAYENIKSIRFEGGVNSYIEWGSDHWEYSQSEFNVMASGLPVMLFNFEYWDGLAFIEASLHFILWTRIDGTDKCVLSFIFSTIAYNHFTKPWGSARIGNAAVISTQ